METMAIRPDYARVKRIVRDIHDDFGISAPPVNPVEIARNLGAVVEFVTFNDIASDVSGFYDPVTDTINVNANEYPLRQTFTVAHELGHRMLHREWAMSNDYRVLRRDADYLGDESHEKEANAFAANLLVPRFMLDRYYDKMSREGLSKLFAVSVPMINNRIKLEYGI